MRQENKMIYNPSEILSSLENANEILETVWKNIPNSIELGWAASDFDRFHNIGIDLMILMERCREEIAKTV
jgi:hypothetical protein